MLFKCIQIEHFAQIYLNNSRNKNGKTSISDIEAIDELIKLIMIQTVNYGCNFEAQAKPVVKISSLQSREIFIFGKILNKLFIKEKKIFEFLQKHGYMAFYW